MTAAPPPARVFSTADPAEAHAYLCRTYISTTARPLGDQARLRMCDEQHDLGRVGVQDFRYTAGLEQLIPPVGRLMLVRTVAGRWRRDTIGEERRMGPGDICLAAQPDRPHLARWEEPVRLQVVGLDPTLLLDAAPGRDHLLPRFTGLGPSSPQGRQLLTAAFDAVVRWAAVGGPARTEVATDLAAALVASVPNTAEPGPVAGGRLNAARPRVLRVAIGHVHDHAHADIGIQDLADAAGVSRQAVHLAFRRHLGTTPRAYLERVRLDRLHRDLTDLDPDVTTVDQLARLWGFGRLDRLRRDYERTYGATPEATLRS